MKRMLIVRSLIVLALVALLAACGGAEDRKAKYFQRGMELFDQGNLVKARLEFKNVLQIDPKDAEAYYMFGRIEEEEQNWRKAYALLLRAVELDPKHVDAQVHLGRLYVMAGETRKGLATAVAALKVDPKSSTALVLKAVAEARLGNKDQAMNEAMAAMELDPGSFEAISLLAALYADQGQMPQAIAMARKGLEQKPDSIVAHLLLARLYEKQGNQAGAIEMLKQIIKLDPSDISRQVRLASYYLQKGYRKKAEQVYNEAIAALPDSTAAKLALISFLVKEGDDKRALDTLKGFIEQEPENYELQLRLVRLYVARKDKERAVALLRQVIDKAGITPPGLTARTQLASLLAKDDPAQARTLVEEVLKEDPKSKDALLLRAAMSLQSDDPDKGIADLRTLLREDPGYVKALRLKAKAHLQKGEIALARESLEAAIQAEPQEAFANFELAQLLLRTGELEDAAAVLEKMRRFVPNERAVLQAIAQIRIKQGDQKRLAEVAKELQEKFPKNPLGYYYEGLALQADKKYQESVAAFEKSLELRPKAVEPLIALARSYMMLKQPEVALSRVQQVIGDNPGHFLAINLEGEIYLSLKRLDDAEKAFQKAISIKPEWATPYKNLARVKAAKGDRQAALEVIEKGYAKSGDVGLGLELASSLERKGDRAGAMKLYREILAKRPRLALAANNLAMGLIRGTPDQKALDEAYQLVKGFELSENAVLLDTLGWVLLKRGEADEAILVLQRAARSGKGKLPEIDYHLAAAYYEKGRKRDARKSLEKALASDQAFEGKAQAQALLDKL